jgi:hypothetical protein
MRRKLLLGLAVLVSTLAVTPMAGATTDHYFSGKLMNYKNPACWWSIGEDCATYWNYYVASFATFPSSPVGQTDVGYDWSGGMAGYVGPAYPGTMEVCKAWISQANGYNRASVAYWQGGDNYISDAWGNTVHDQQC